MADTGTTRSTLVVMVCTLASRLLGFVRMAVITAIFGAGGVADVINLTFSIPNNLRKLLAEGALSSAFIPVLSESIVKDPGGSEPKRIIRNILSFQILILVPVCILCMIFARPLIKIVLAEFSLEWQIELSVNLFRWFINYLLFISISAVLMGALNSNNRFMIPAVTPILFSVSVISSIIFLHGSLGVYSMAVGVLAGGIAQILIQIPQFRKLGYDFKPDFCFRNERFRRIMKQWVPVLATSSILTVTQQIAFRFATGLEEGSTSAITNAIVFWQFPFGLFSASISTVLFPKMSRQAALGDQDGLRDTIQYGIRYLSALLIPSAVFLCMFGKEIIAVTIQRGMFTAQNTEMTAMVLTGYSLGLLSSGVYNFLQRYLYSSKDYKIPFRITVLVGTLDIILSIILKETRLGVIGLALANTISFTAGMFVLIAVARRRLGNVESGAIFKTLLKITVSMIPLVIFIYAVRMKFGNLWRNGSTPQNLIMLIAVFTGSCAIILGMYRLTKIEMLDDILRKRKRKNR